MNIEYPDNVKLSNKEIFAIRFHTELDRKAGCTDKSRWPEWLVIKMMRAVNNPFKGG